MKYKKIGLLMILLFVVKKTEETVILSNKEDEPLITFDIQ